MVPTFPNASNWLGTLVDLAGCCVLIGISLWIAQAFTDKIWIQVASVVLAMWIWDYIFMVMRNFLGDSLERRTR